MDVLQGHDLAARNLSLKHAQLRSEAQMPPALQAGPAAGVSLTAFTLPLQTTSVLRPSSPDWNCFAASRLQDDSACLDAPVGWAPELPGPAAGVSLTAFALSSAAAIIPWTVTLAYFGSLAKSMADIFNGASLPEGATQYFIFIASGLTMVVTAAYTTIFSRCV